MYYTKISNYVINSPIRTSDHCSSSRKKNRRIPSLAHSVILQPTHNESMTFVPNFLMIYAIMRTDFLVLTQFLISIKLLSSFTQLKQNHRISCINKKWGQNQILVQSPIFLFCSCPIKREMPDVCGNHVSEVRFMLSLNIPRFSIPSSVSVRTEVYCLYIVLLIQFIMYFTVILIIVLTILFGLYYGIAEYFLNKLHMFNIIKGIPGPKAFPIIGNAHLFIGNTTALWKQILNLGKNYQLLWRVWIGAKLFLVIENPEYIKTVLNSPNITDKSVEYEKLKPIVGDGLFTAPGKVICKLCKISEICKLNTNCFPFDLILASVWDSHRKVLNKMFLMKNIKSHMDVFVHHSIALMEKIETFVEKELDVFDYVFRCTLDIIYDASLDTQINSLTNPDCKLAESIRGVMDIETQRVFKLWLHPSFIFYNTARGKKFQACLAYLDNVTNKIIKEKMESMLRSKINRQMTAEKLGQKQKTLFDFLFELSHEGEIYTEENTRDEINTLIIAGSETSATTISFVLLMLATFPEIQDKVYEEINRIYCSDDPKCVPMTYNDIKSMKLLENVIKETLRLFPAGPVIARKVTQDIKVTKNWTIPKGCSAVFLIYKLHRSAKYWPQPLVFDPDRFLPERNCSTCFFPFSYGQRNCIGQNFAMLEMATVISTLIKKFRITIDKPIEIAKIDVKLSITLKPMKPIILKFEKRN
ncbi:cytochrome P450 4C1-like [Vespa velutina]|uniref:cytochrome P450 4C1-like n=1 Tax=Vespa velutina TaxID=202808 RepID=UPI001FB2B1BF|nr:cytochrome P450 4C1-like [Vespa velutina]